MISERASILLKGAALAALIGASLAAAVKAHAAEPAPAAGSGEISVAQPEVSVRVRVIHARSGAKHFDPHLDDLKRYLEKYRYNSYRLEIDDSLHLAVAGTQSLGLLSGKNLTATLVAVTPEKATVRLVLNGQSGQMLDTTVSTAPNHLFFIAGPRYDDGVLFIAIEPSYDPNNLPQPAVSSRDGKTHE